jgi:hypothetical protein
LLPPKTAAPAAAEPIAQSIVAGVAAQPAESVEVARGQNSADDEVAMAVPIHVLELAVPEVRTKRVGKVGVV